ncbi:hypothetical protein Calow_2036 [Caldicellulosiruptor owensensis OL]|uniref:Uncharacterized protein n=1 Tax=Caldicellulosiruptor owensensis (strain ATCC 700167 / DSM 13100 / OL) TaxID=632518 RepID=E4Q662_CALOW|nr:hypothetical protein [Caldicellulosiruptor owensensis]ADQ05547.1 hypothetical protein Calow_2036 [Caldicellulosiruptor owensensis OL]
MYKIVHEKFVFSPKKGAFWFYVVRWSFWSAEIILAAPEGAGKKLVWRKRYYFPFAAQIFTLSTRLAEAFLI